MMESSCSRPMPRVAGHHLIMTNVTVPGTTMLPAIRAPHTMPWDGVPISSSRRTGQGAWGKLTT